LLSNPSNPSRKNWLYAWQFICVFKDWLSGYLPVFLI
jgi:hypothetical protein